MILLSLVFSMPGAPSSSAPLSEVARLAAVYDVVLAARFDQAEAQLKQTCPPAPEAACKALGAVSTWWQILLDPRSRLLDAALDERAAAAIAASDGWTKREPQRAEAWFYLAGSYGPLVQWRVLRGERLAAARDASKVKAALERTLQLDPTLDDAYFGIGLYHYYAAVAPAAAKVLRWLFLLPGGDRVQGLREMLRARERGQLLTGEADYQLHLVYLGYEQKPAEALKLLERLDARYPSNPLFLQRIAEVQSGHLRDHPASAAAWRLLVSRAQAGQVYMPRRAQARARLGFANELDAMYETDRAVDELKAVTLDLMVAPETRAEAHLQLGAAYDRLGYRSQATPAYEAAVARAPEDDTLQIRERARARLRQTPDARRAEAYRLSLEGWRALERGDAASAEALLARAVALAPTDVIARYRYAHTLEARGDHERARQELATVLAAPEVPPIAHASALVDEAQRLERAGDRARALALYRSAAQMAGGDPAARDQAARAIKRLSP